MLINIRTTLYITLTQPGQENKERIYLYMLIKEIKESWSFWGLGLYGSIATVVFFMV
jgi:hypothetical protein